LAGAQALDLDARIGNVDIGEDADLVLVQASGGEPLARTPDHAGRADDERVAAEQTLFALLLGLQEPAVGEVFVAGHAVVARPVVLR
jgi:guanine deaminase